LCFPDVFDEDVEVRRGIGAPVPPMAIDLPFEAEAIAA